MILSQREIDIWEKHPTDSKRDLHARQRIFLAYNPESQYYCMCGLTKRKIKYVQFNEWYAEITN